MASVPPRSSASSAGNTRVADRREQDRGVQRAPAADRSAPCAEAAPSASASSRASLTPRHDVHLGAPGQRDLRGDMGTAAEPVDAQPAAGGQLGAHQRAVADDARAQQRGQLVVGVARRQPVRESSRDRGELGIAAVGVPAGVAGFAGTDSPGRAGSTCTARRYAAARRYRRDPPPRNRRTARGRSGRPPRRLRARGSRRRRCTGRSPSATCRSVRHTPQACTATSSSPTPGRGTAR